MLKTKLHYYCFNTDNPDQKHAYNELKDKLKGMGLKMFDSISMEHSRWYETHIKPLDGQIIELETNYLFNNQWNTAPTSTSEKGLRVFDWAEAIYSNRKLKQGHWLEQTPEMVEIRRNTLKCGYCGAMYKAQQKYIFCKKCLHSEYLKADQLHLLRLLPIDMENTTRKPLTKAETNWLMPQYVAAQTELNIVKKKNQREKIIMDYRETCKNAKTEKDGMLWLLDHDISIDNCIYYSHTNTFCFGWRSPLDSKIKQVLKDKLSGFFPFQWEMK